MSQEYNILDSPVPEIKTPILKPVKATRVTQLKSLADTAKDKLNKFADWIMAYVPPEVRKPANKRINALKKIVNSIYNSGIKKKATALKGYLTSYEIKGGSKTAPKTFMGYWKGAVLKFLREKEKPIKVKMILVCEFYKKKISSFGYFHTEVEIITKSSDLDVIYRKTKDVILEKFANYQNRGSGWIFKKIVALEIHVDKYNPIAARSFIPLPKKLMLKKAIINFRNEDNQCFKWAVTTAIFPIETTHPERIPAVLRKAAEKLNWQGLEFPVEVDKIEIFEENNPGYGVNVFGYKETEEVYPIRVSENGKKKINLLMISNEETNHYCWVKNMSRLLNSQVTKSKNQRFFCDRCLCSFYKQSSLDKHSEYCKDHEAVKIKLPKKGTRLCFKNYNHSMRVPFVIYADFECFTHKLASCQPNDEESYTEKFQMHKPSGYCYMVMSDKPQIVKYTATSDEDVGQKFVESLEETVRKLYSSIRHKKVVMVDGDSESYKNATHCHICEGLLNNTAPDGTVGIDKVLDHDHLTGRYRGAAHNACNINYKIPKHIPVVFHNLAGYDAHLFIKNLGVTEGKVDCIPNNEEKYISFKKEIVVGKFTDKNGKTQNVKREIRFIDSFKFMASSLDRLVGNLKKDEFKNMKGQFESDKLDMLLRKGVFPYDYFDSIEKLDDTSLPPKEEFYSRLNNKHISDVDYEHAQKVWQEFGIRTMKEYHDLYLKCDVILLADVFETFRDVCLKNYRLDPCWYYTAPGLSWDAMLKKTKIQLELLSDPDMLLMIERGVRGGISMISKRYAKANNKYMKNYDPAKESAYIKYLDANNLYGWAMSEPMPTHGFKWMHKEEIKYWRKHPCILEVDLEYPTELHELHNEYPLAPERLLADSSSSGSGVEKLIPNLNNKTKYVVHHQILKLYESLGLKVTKVHRGIVFKESNWLGEYISLNTNLRTAAKNDFEKDFFKLMNNSVFGKTMENIRNRQDIRLATNEAQVKRLVGKPNYKRRTIFSENLVAVHMGKTELNFNKPIYVGMSILDASKALMYDFHYNYIKPKYGISLPDGKAGSRAELLFTDTDSLMYEIKTEDFYKDIYADLESKFDTSAYGSHAVIDKKINKKVIGMMKDETSGVEITEFVGLRSKLYSYRVAEKEEKKCKGIKKAVVKDTITFNDYVKCLFSGQEQMRKMNVLRSEKHQIYAETVNKVALSANDDKRTILEDRIHTNAVGYNSREL